MTDPSPARVAADRGRTERRAADADAQRWTQEAAVTVEPALPVPAPTPERQGDAESRAFDLSGWTGYPHRLAVDSRGYVWRVYDDGTWSMAPTNPDNSPIPQPVTFYVPERASR